ARTTRGAKTAELPHQINVFVSSKKRLFDLLERDSIWVFATARSGTSWVAQDILGWGNRTRPMDETGLGRMAAPLEWQPERFFFLPNRLRPFESGYDFESGMRARQAGGMPPFERYFAERYGGETMEQIRSRRHDRMYSCHLRNLALEHVLRVWGGLDYQRIVF